jgi:Ca2+-binding RTX toxin-like protein
MLLGGDGDDDLFGAGGEDVLLGGAGRDILDGGSDRDLLIGGLNEDRLQGGTDDDILIGGYTAHDADLAKLDAIMAIWGSADSFNARVATLTSPGGLLVAGETVFDDDAADHIIGAAGRDLAFADTTKNWDGVKDTISLSSSQDTLIALN